MKVVIACSKRFGKEVIQICEQSGLEIVAVFCPCDDRVIFPYAKSKGYPVLSEEYLTDRKLKPDIHFDLGITAHFFGKIPQSTIEQATHGWLGYHPSLLPRHRGRNSIQWAIDAKDAITGGTLYWLNEKMDAGDIAYQEWTFLDDSKTAKQVWDDDLAPIGKTLFMRAFEDLKKGVVLRKPQRPLEQFATYGKPVEKL